MLYFLKISRTLLPSENPDPYGCQALIALYFYFYDSPYASGLMSVNYMCAWVIYACKFLSS